MITELPIVVVKVLKPSVLPKRRVTLVAIKNVTDSDDLMIINKSGIAIRLAVDNLQCHGEGHSRCASY